MNACLYIIFFLGKGYSVGAFSYSGQAATSRWNPYACHFGTNFISMPMIAILRYIKFLMDMKLCYILWMVILHCSEDGSTYQ